MTTSFRIKVCIDSMNGRYELGYIKDVDMNSLNKATCLEDAEESFRLGTIDDCKIYTRNKDLNTLNELMNGTGYIFIKETL